MVKGNYENGVLKIYISGEMDHHICSELRHDTDKLISEFRPKKAILNFGKITFCDSSGIAFVMGRYKFLKEIGGILLLEDVPLRISKIFKLANLQKIVEIKEHVD